MGRPWLLRLLRSQLLLLLLLLLLLYNGKKLVIKCILHTHRQSLLRRHSGCRGTMWGCPKNFTSNLLDFRCLVRLSLPLVRLALCLRVLVSPDFFSGASCAGIGGQ